MHQAVELPLALHLFLAPQAEATQSFRRANVAEYGFHDRHAMAVDCLALRTVYAVFHPVGVIGQAFVFDHKRYLSAGTVAMVGRARVLHASVFPWARSTLQQTAFEVHPDLAILGCPLPSIGQTLAGWADAG